MLSAEPWPPGLPGVLKTSYSGYYFQRLCCTTREINDHLVLCKLKKKTNIYAACLGSALRIIGNKKLT